MIQVEIWSDFVCPFCYIGKRRFERALDQFEHKDEVKVVFRSFELDPHAPQIQDQNVHERLAEKYGMSLEQAKAMNERVGRQAEEVGLHYKNGEALGGAIKPTPSGVGYMDPSQQTFVPSSFPMVS